MRSVMHAQGLCDHHAKHMHSHYLDRQIVYPAQVTEVVYRVEQAKYCSTLMQQLSKAGLTEQGKASLKKQIEDCAALLQEPPACAVAQAGQDEVSLVDHY